MVDSARYNEQLKPARPDEVQALKSITELADAGRSIGTSFLSDGTTVYGFTRPVSDPDGVVVTRITDQGVAEGRVGYNTMRDAKKEGTLGVLLKRVF
jgi:hypothetical protein